MFRKSVSSALVLVLAVLFGCCAPPRIDEYEQERRVESSHSAETEKIVLAQVDVVPITLADVERRMRGLSSLAQFSLDSPAARQRFVQAMVLVEMLAQEAEDGGLGADPMASFLVDRALANIVLERMAREETAQFRPTEEMLRAAYDENVTHYQRPHEFRFLVLVTATEQEATEIAREYRELAGSGGPEELLTVFRQLQDQHTTDQFASSLSGDLGFLSQDTVTAAFGADTAEQVFTSENPGVLYGPVQYREKWALLLTTREHRAIDESFEEAEMEIREAIINDYREQAREHLTERLRSSGEVEIDGEALSILRSPEVPHQPARGLRLLELSDTELEPLLNPHIDANALIDFLAPSVEASTEGTGEAVEND